MLSIRVPATAILTLVWYLFGVVSFYGNDKQKKKHLRDNHILRTFINVSKLMRLLAESKINFELKLHAYLFQYISFARFELICFYSTS